MSAIDGLQQCVDDHSYRVQCPHVLWHLDGNHALIWWKMVIHGGIDGFSRLIVYLRCSFNNRADTVFNLFVSACNDVGIPAHVRSDRGSENVLVAIFYDPVSWKGKRESYSWYICA